jgi:hypothetical protein
MRLSIVGDDERICFAAPVSRENAEPATDAHESSGDLAIPGRGPMIWPTLSQPSISQNNDQKLIQQGGRQCLGN